MRINTNVTALNAYNQLKSTNENMSKSLERLSSGKRINSAADDAAGLAISEKMKGQMNGLAQAQRNAQDSISMIQTAEGALQETHSILQRMRELSVQAGNDTNTADDRAEIQEEIDQLKDEIDNIGETTEFNTKKLLNGGAGLETTTNTETVDGTDKEWASVQGGSADTETGTIDITSATAASAGSYDLTVSTGEGTNESITVNGNTVNYDASASSATVSANNLQTVLNDNADKLGIEEVEDADVTSSGTMTIENAAIGSANELDISAGSTAVATSTAIDVSNEGTDIDITAGTNGGNATAIADTDYVSSGNSIEVTGGKFEGLKLEFDGEEMSTTAGTNKFNVEIESNGVVQSQIGANDGQNMSISINDMRSEALGVSNLDVTSAENANEAISTLDDAIQKVSSERSKLGAKQNRLEHITNNLSAAEENLTAANSRIRDVDMASEMMQMSKTRILSQAGTAMLAQANQKSQGVMQLLG
ncbi:flagellin [Acetohalobium arabaticum]|uniref:Flagellin n=1 Tax=Acetohalobium arabaticum (strain ATCC 49924 / DSM 5501 / Z-7288) TaxID=574087 RepID=D9QTN8_ACEAZ|nr:flagellin [Acetohalobium arabaticum]ADL11802.1 flagellin domain protein [Acetohalobium arabaticum DSM 5501]